MRQSAPTTIVVVSVVGEEGTFNKLSLLLRTNGDIVCSFTLGATYIVKSIESSSQHDHISATWSWPLTCHGLTNRIQKHYTMLQLQNPDKWRAKKFDLFMFQTIAHLLEFFWNQRMVK